MNWKETQEEDDVAKEETVAQDHENRAMKEKIALDGSVQVDFEDRKKTKNELKQQLYYLLTVYAGKTLPWGTLTGIRPTKIPMELLEEGKSEDEIRSYMKETYLASDEKIDLSLSVAKRELELLSRIDYENGYCMWAFRFVRAPVCIALLPPIRWQNGRTAWMNIWMHWKKKLPSRQRYASIKY